LAVILCCLAQNSAEKQWPHFRQMKGDAEARSRALCLAAATAIAIAICVKTETKQAANQQT